MLRFNGRKWIELVFGLLPVTLVIGPLLPYAMLLITLPFLIGGAAGVSVLKFSDATLPLFVSVFAAALGLSALWVVFLLDLTKMRSRSKLFLVLGVALAAGLAADLYSTYLLVFSSSANRYRVLWAMLLLGPLWLGFKYLLLMQREAWHRG